MNKVRKAHHDLKFELTLGSLTMVLFVKRLESNLHFHKTKLVHFFARF